MRYLIDTNILLRCVNEPNAISKDVKDIIADHENLIYVSSVSIQEIFMLMQEKKLNVKQWQKPVDVIGYIRHELFFAIKYVQEEHLITFAKLTPVENHSDPFDRMIIAQAITENIPLISSDKKFPKYIKFGLDFIQNK
jgi:PIN domain nuclease of toxin-antitoxin system